MNRYDYRILIQKEVDDSSASASAVINNIIREVYQECVREIKPYISSNTSETQTVTVGTSSYTPTNDFTDIKEVLYKMSTSDDYNTLRQITREDYLKNHLNDSNGTPTYWSRDGANIVISPPPSDAGTLMIDGTIQFNEMDDDNETSLIPDDFSRVIVLGGVARFLAYEKDPAAVEYFQMFEKAKFQMLQELITKTEQVRPKLWGK